MEYEVVVWSEPLSDGSIGYAAVCPTVGYAHGQGDTEAEALAEVADTIAFFLEEGPGQVKVKVGQAAQDEMSEKFADLEAEGIGYWIRQVAPARRLATA